MVVCVCACVHACVRVKLDILSYIMSMLLLWLQVAFVRLAVCEQNITDDEILSVLQCYDFNVDQAIAAFYEGLVSIYYFKFSLIFHLIVL